MEMREEGSLRLTHKCCHPLTITNVLAFWLRHHNATRGRGFKTSVSNGIWNLLVVFPRIHVCTTGIYSSEATSSLETTMNYIALLAPLWMALFVNGRLGHSIDNTCMVRFRIDSENTVRYIFDLGTQPVILDFSQAGVDLGTATSIQISKNTPDCVSFEVNDQEIVLDGATCLDCVVRRKHGPNDVATPINEYPSNASSYKRKVIHLTLPLELLAIQRKQSSSCATLRSDRCCVSVSRLLVVLLSSLRCGSIIEPLAMLARYYSTTSVIDSVGGTIQQHQR